MEEEREGRMRVQGGEKEGEKLVSGEHLNHHHPHHNLYQREGGNQDGIEGREGGWEFSRGSILCLEVTTILAGSDYYCLTIEQSCLISTFTSRWSGWQQFRRIFLDIICTWS